MSGCTGVYDGSAHGATGTAVGVETVPADLSALLHLGSSFASVPGGTAQWTFDGNANYNAASGNATVVIVPNTQMGTETSSLIVRPDPTNRAPTASATASAANTGNTSVVAAEYFIDKKRKSGTGVRITATFDSAIQSIEATLDPAKYNSLTRGRHTIYGVASASVQNDCASRNPRPRGAAVGMARGLMSAGNRRRER